jgi:hypothetical protein
MGRSGLTFGFDHCRKSTWWPPTPFLLVSARILSGLARLLSFGPPDGSPPAQALRTVPTLTEAKTSAPGPQFCAPARPCGGRWIGSKYVVLARMRLLSAPGAEAPWEKCGLAHGLRLHRKVQFFPIVNATTSGGGVQMRSPGNLGGSPDDPLREIAATAQNTHPMAAS